MKDNFGREIDYMRISLTQDCNLHCAYCRPVQEKNSGRFLDAGDVEKISRTAVTLGITRFRITGGEPLLHPECGKILKGLKALPQTEYVGITTNGILLKQRLGEICEAGTDSVNISLDTMNREKYHRITGKDDLDTVISGIDKAYHAGLQVKVNCVPGSDFTMEDLSGFLELIREHKMAVRFIEYMPMAGQDYRGLPISEIKQMLEKRKISLQKTEEQMGSGPAVYYKAAGYRGRIGFIEPLHGKFCRYCNRIRVTGDAGLQTCLFYGEQIDLKTALNQEKWEEALRQTIGEAVWNKQAEHHFEKKAGCCEMNRIGG